MHRLVIVLVFASSFFTSPARADDTPSTTEDGPSYLSDCSDSNDADDYAGAIDSCSEALKAGGLDNAETFMAYLYRGMAHHSRNEDDAAIADFTEAFAADPDHKNTDFAHFERGAAYLSEKQYDKALADFDAAVKLTPTEAMYYELRGTTDFDLGRRNDAVADLSKAIDMKPKEADAYSERSVVYLMQGDFAGAIADSAQVLQLNPDDTSARSVMGESYYFQGDYPQALQKFDEGVAKFPDDDYAMIWRYLAAQRAGQDGGKALAAEFDAMKDKSGWTYVLGQLFLGKSSGDKVLAAVGAATTDPDVEKQALCQAKTFMGEFYRNGGQNDKATALFKEAAQLCAQDSVGRILVEQGLKPHAAKKGKRSD